MPLSPAARVLALFRTKGLHPAQPRMNIFQFRGPVLRGFPLWCLRECVVRGPPQVLMVFDVARFHATGGCVFVWVCLRKGRVWLDDASRRTSSSSILMDKKARDASSALPVFGLI
ncbi:hypothetical protein EP01_13910 [Bdellovibrio bacteriovorus]|nr:hypothetical protein EP01_13910 [Bdellovibrio bacteriovorus]